MTSSDEKLTCYLRNTSADLLVEWEQCVDRAQDLRGAEMRDALREANGLFRAAALFRAARDQAEVGGAERVRQWVLETMRDRDDIRRNPDARDTLAEIVDLADMAATAEEWVKT